MRRVWVIVAMVALVGSACSQAPEGPLDYTIDVDAESTPTDKHQYSAFFPSELKAMGGDTITFDNKATEAPHTITFGVAPDRGNQPPILTPTGENAVVVAPCDTDDEPTPELLECSNTELGAYDGTGYWNSGFLQPASAPDDAGAKSVDLELAEDIPAGNFTFLCILHPFMTGTVQVVDDAADRSDVEEIRQAAADGAAQTKADASELEEPEAEEDGDTVTMAAGWGDRVTSINRFGPAELEIEAGQTVAWEASNPYEPHNVTFGSPPDDASPFVAGGLESGSDYRQGAYANSGLFGAEGTPFAGSYSLTFPNAGTYEYTCLLHPGMDGTVRVTEPVT